MLIKFFGPDINLDVPRITQATVVSYEGRLGSTATGTKAGRERIVAPLTLCRLA